MMSGWDDRIADNRVDIFYVLDRLDEVLLADSDKQMEKLADFRDELIYNLGVNTRLNEKGTN